MIKAYHIPYNNHVYVNHFMYGRILKVLINKLNKGKRMIKVKAKFRSDCGEGGSFGRRRHFKGHCRLRQSQ